MRELKYGTGIGMARCMGCVCRVQLLESLLSKLLVHLLYLDEDNKGTGFWGLHCILYLEARSEIILPLVKQKYGYTNL